MVNSPDPIKHGHPAPVDNTPKQAASEKDNYHSQYHAGESAHGFLIKMFPHATNDEINQIFDLWMKNIASAIQQNQKYHEEQRDIRKEESGDDD